MCDRGCCDAEKRSHAGLHEGAIGSGKRRSLACTVKARAANLGIETAPAQNTRVMSEYDSDIIMAMKRKSGVPSRSASSRSKPRLQRRATTFRLEPRLQRGLELLSDIRRAPLNRLVNEAVDNYLDVQATRLETDLEATLQRVKAYRAADPDFEHAIAGFAEAEAAHAAEDPVEGSTVRARGPAQRLVRELIRG